MAWRGVSSAQTKLWSVALFAISTLAAGVSWQVVHDRAAVINSAEFAGQQLALNFAAFVSGTFRAADFVTEYVRITELDHPSSVGVVNAIAMERWKETLVKRPFLRAIAFLEPDATVRSSIIRHEDGSFQTPTTASIWLSGRGLRHI